MILYSFRRCPYAMRARLALLVAGIQVELREIVLRNKAPEFLETSPKGTVPVLVTDDQVIEESLDIMLWALGRNDPEGWLDMPDEGHQIIATIDGPFKTALDRYKYDTRYGSNAEEEREKAALILRNLDEKLQKTRWLMADKPTLADMATITFIRQFANTDRTWFDAQDWTALRHWLDTFLASKRYNAIMDKYPKWSSGDPATYWPE